MLLSISFQAYINWLKTQSVEEPRLPGLTHLSDHHLFFLNFAQVCSNIEL